jgi:two-component system OmpR family response regulator
VNAARARPVTEAGARARAPRVLLVEDDAPSARRLTQLLSEDGFAVEWIADGPAACARLASGPRPDALVVDYRLPGGDGMTVARAARAQWRDIPLLFVTSYSEVVQRQPAFDPPAVLLSKPVAYAELVGALEGAIDGGARVRDPV